MVLIDELIPSVSLTQPEYKEEIAVRLPTNDYIDSLLFPGSPDNNRAGKYGFICQMVT